MGNGKEEELKRLAREAAQQQNVVTARQEYIRDQLEAYANTAGATYDAQCRQYDGQAKALLTTVIHPWLDNIQSSELFRHIREALAGTSWIRLNLSDPISYFWPREAFSDAFTAQEYHRKPFDITAKVILDQYRRDGKDIAANIKRQGSAYQKETWEAMVHFERIGNSPENVYISRWPKEGRGWAFAMTARSYHLSLSEGIDMEPPADIHPLVLVEFAGQIQSGRVWDVLEASFQRSLHQE